MPRILIIDDEITFRASIARGVARIAGVEVEQAGSLDEALAGIDRNAPDLIVSDIDLPDRSGIELLGELGKRGRSIPVVFVSAYLKAYRAQLPRHANIETLEKPVSIDELRRVISARLGAGSVDDPFTVADYVQLASLGRHSVLIEVVFPDARRGEVVMHDGELWSAEIGDRQGRDAFGLLAFARGCAIHCTRNASEPGARNLEGSGDALLLDAARLIDETTRDGELPAEASLPPHWRDSLAPEHASPGPTNGAATPEDDATRADAEAVETAAEAMFNRHWDRAIESLLRKDYQAALEAFRAAEALNPADPKVTANLARLKALGFGADQGETDG